MQKVKTKYNVKEMGPFVLQPNEDLDVDCGNRYIEMPNVRNNYVRDAKSQVRFYDDFFTVGDNRITNKNPHTRYYYSSVRRLLVFNNYPNIVMVGVASPESAPDKMWVILQAKNAQEVDPICNQIEQNIKKSNNPTNFLANTNTISSANNTQLLNTGVRRDSLATGTNNFNKTAVLAGGGAALVGGGAAVVGGTALMQQHTAKSQYVEPPRVYQTTSPPATTVVQTTHLQQSQVRPLSMDETYYAVNSNTVNAAPPPSRIITTTETVTAPYVEKQVSTTTYNNQIREVDNSDVITSQRVVGVNSSAPIMETRKVTSVNTMTQPTLETEFYGSNNYTYYNDNYGTSGIKDEIYAVNSGTVQHQLPTKSTKEIVVSKTIGGDEEIYAVGNKQLQQQAPRTQVVNSRTFDLQHMPAEFEASRVVTVEQPRTRISTMTTTNSQDVGGYEEAFVAKQRLAVNAAPQQTTQKGMMAGMSGPRSLDEVVTRYRTASVASSGSLNSVRSGGDNMIFESKRFVEVDHKTGTVREVDNGPIFLYCAQFKRPKRKGLTTGVYDEEVSSRAIGQQQHKSPPRMAGSNVVENGYTTNTTITTTTHKIQQPATNTEMYSSSSQPGLLYNSTVVEPSYQSHVIDSQLNNKYFTESVVNDYGRIDGQHIIVQPQTGNQMGYYDGTHSGVIEELQHAF